MMRARRSALYLPGSNARALEKARTLAADVLILDLEDAVAPDQKDIARQQAAQAIAARGFGRREIILRINALDSIWWQDDLKAATGLRPDGLLLPKVNMVDDLDRVANALNGAIIPLWAMIESPRAILNLSAIAGWKHGQQKLAGLVVGTNDIAREARMALIAGRAPMAPLLAQCVIAARANGLDVLDGVYNKIGDDEGLAAECQQARDFGFDGKTLIHPSQIDICNRTFTPDADEVARARAIIAAFESPENAGKGALRVDGQMVELLHAEIARRTLALAEAGGAQNDD